MPCRDKWNAFIFASILSGSPPLEAGGAPRTFILAPGGGLRALFNTPIGVEEAVIELVMGGSDTDRREGIRGVFVGSVGGLAGTASGSWDTAPGAKSWDSSGATGALLGGVAIVLMVYLYGMK